MMKLFAALTALLLSLTAFGESLSPAGEAASKVIDCLHQDDYPGFASLCADSLKSKIDAEQFKNIRRSLEQTNGRFQQPGKISENRRNNGTQITMSVEFEDNFQDLHLAFSPENRLTGLFLGKRRPKISTRNNIILGREWPLPGTLTLPAGREKSPCIILVHGSGSPDRDETVMNNKPFADLAEQLSRQGIAVLRYEKRSFFYPAEFIGKPFTVREETVDDAIHAVEAIRRHPAIDPDRILVLGHSLGGMLIPRIAGGTAIPAGYLILAGGTRPLEDLMLEQSRYLIPLQLSDPARAAQAMLPIQAMHESVKKLQPGDSKPPAELFGLPAEYWLDLKSYDPAAAARDIDKPILILQGGRDYQVTEKDFRRWQALQENNPKIRCILYPKLHHLFLPGKGGAERSTPDEYLISQSIPAEVIMDIAAFIDEIGK